MTVAGAALINDCNLELTLGMRYGLIGNNGCGKTAMLNAIARREIPLPDHLDMFHLHEEAPPTDRTAVESVIDHVKEELERLEKLEEAIIEQSGADDDRLELISSRITELNPDTFEVHNSQPPYTASSVAAVTAPFVRSFTKKPCMRRGRGGFTAVSFAPSS